MDWMYIPACLQAGELEFGYNKLDTVFVWMMFKVSVNLKEER